MQLKLPVGKRDDHVWRNSKERASTAYRCLREYAPRGGSPLSRGLGPRRWTPAPVAVWALAKGPPEPRSSYAPATFRAFTASDRSGIPDDAREI